MLISMRTTMSLDDALVQRLREQALEFDITFGEAVNRAIRRGLDALPPSRVSEPTVTYGDPADPPVDDAALRVATARLDEAETRRQAGLP